MILLEDFNYRSRKILLNVFLFSFFFPHGFYNPLKEEKEKGILYFCNSLVNPSNTSPYVPIPSLLSSHVLREKQWDL